MIWVSIILGIIEAIPTLLPLLKDLLVWLQSHPLRPAKEDQFKGILASYLQHKDAGRLEAELMALKQS